MTIVAAGGGWYFHATVRQPEDADGPACMFVYDGGRVHVWTTHSCAVEPVHEEGVVWCRGWVKGRKLKALMAAYAL